MYRASYCIVLMTNEMHNSYNQFLFHSFLSALHVSNESSRSSSGARHYTVLHSLVQSVYYAVLVMKHVEQTKNCGIEIYYKNCASRWSITHIHLFLIYAICFGPQFRPPSDDIIKI